MVLVSRGPASSIVCKNLFGTHLERLHLASVIGPCVHDAVLSGTVEALRLVPAAVGATAAHVRGRTCLGCVTLAVMVLAVHLVLRVMIPLRWLFALSRCRSLEVHSPHCVAEDTFEAAPEEAKEG